jgi:hypothetical protein
MAVATVGVGAEAEATDIRQAKRLALRWLASHQNPSGSWGDDPRAEILTTAIVVQALRGAEWEGPQLCRAEAWLAGSAPQVTEDLAELTVALAGSDLGLDLELAAAALEVADRQVRPATGAAGPPLAGGLGVADRIGHGGFSMGEEVGWGVARGHRANVGDSAAALRALLETGSVVPNQALALAHLDGTQLAAGGGAGAWSLAAEPAFAALAGWETSSSSPEGVVFATAKVLLGAATLLPPSDVAAAVAWLRIQQNADQGFGGGGTSTLEETALVYRALIAGGVPASDDALEAAMDSYLLPAQIVTAGDPDRGSWAGDAYRTALALSAILASGLTTDSDGDSVPDPEDPDDDNDLYCDPGEFAPGICGGSDAFPLDASEAFDLDGDGLGDNSDPDEDGDGICNPGQAPIPGVCSGSDAFPSNRFAHSDLDGDQIPDGVDGDIDGDGVPNTADAFPFDANESIDTDRDGVGNEADLDDDGDGIADAIDNCPVVATECVWEVTPITADADVETNVQISGQNIAWNVLSEPKRGSWAYVGPDRSIHQLTTHVGAPSVGSEVLVWSGPDAGGDLEIHDWDVLNPGSAPSQKTSNSVDDTSPDLFNDPTLQDVVVYERAGEIYRSILGIYDPGSAVTSDGLTDHSPRIATDWIAWMKTDGDDEIWSKKGAESPVRITDNDVQDVLIDVDAGPPATISWCTAVSAGAEDCFVRTATGQNTQIVFGENTQGSLRVAGGIAAWSAEVDGNWEIFVRPLETGQTMQITTDPADDLNPAVSSSHVVWERIAGEARAVLVYDLAIGNLIQLDAFDSATPARPSLAGSNAAWTRVDTASGWVDVLRARLAPPACDDGEDDDGDGLADYPADPGCRSAAYSKENPQCNDRTDNDQDGLSARRLSFSDVRKLIASARGA